MKKIRKDRRLARMYEIGRARKEDIWAPESDCLLCPFQLLARFRFLLRTAGADPLGLKIILTVLYCSVVTLHCCFIITAVPALRAVDLGFQARPCFSCWLFVSGAGEVVSSALAWAPLSSSVRSC